MIGNGPSVGSEHGERYFSCRHSKGIFVRLNAIKCKLNHDNKIDYNPHHKSGSTPNTSHSRNKSNQPLNLNDHGSPRKQSQRRKHKMARSFQPISKSEKAKRPRSRSRGAVQSKRDRKQKPSRARSPPHTSLNNSYSRSKSNENILRNSPKKPPKSVSRRDHKLTDHTNHPYPIKQNSKSKLRVKNGNDKESKSMVKSRTNEHLKTKHSKQHKRNHDKSKSISPSKQNQI